MRGSSILNFSEREVEFSSIKKIKKKSKKKQKAQKTIHTSVYGYLSFLFFFDFFLIFFNCKTLMTLRMPEEGKAGSGLKK